MTTRRNRRHKINNIHGRNIHRDRSREDNSRHDERIQKAGANIVSNSRSHRLRPPQTPMINEPQRTIYHIEQNTKKTKPIN